MKRNLPKCGGFFCETFLSQSEHNFQSKVNSNEKAKKDMMFKATNVEKNAANEFSISAKM